MTREQLETLLQEEERVGSNLDLLGNQEIEILSLISHGYTSSQMSQELVISREKLDSAKKEIQRKMGLKDEAALIRFAGKQRI